MIQEVVSVDLPVHERLVIKKNRLEPENMTGKEKRISVVGGEVFISPSVIIATGASWLCYYHALQIGAASKVVPIDKLSVVITLALAFFILHEPFTAKSLIGCALIAAGTLFMVL